jgi:hypothetical protein
MNKKLHFKSLLIAGIFMASSTLLGQVQLNQLTDFGTAIMDINNQGEGIHFNGYYDFATNTSSLTESNVLGTSAINDNSDILGMIDDSGEYKAALRIDGTWTALPSSVPLDSEDTLYDISENGVWLVGQTGWDPDTNTAWGFIYNTDTEEFRLLESALYEYSAAYSVNNDGYAVGWVDDLPTGTLRMPAVFAPDGSIILLGEDAGEASGINNNGQVVGIFQGTPFVYDINTDIMESLNIPSDVMSGAFAEISDTGVAVGYFVFPGFSRLPIVYHPDLGDQPLSLIDVLNGFGVDTSDLVGTAYRISSDGNYIAGFTDGPAFMAMGWAVYFDNQLIGGSGSPCDDKTIMECGVEYTAELVPDAGEWLTYTDVPYNYTGSEKVWEFTAPATGLYIFDLDQGVEDADFFLMEACSNEATNIIGGYWAGIGIESIELEEGVTYYLIADLYEFNSGPTTVTVQVSCTGGGVQEPDFDCFQGDGITSSFDNAYNITETSSFRTADDFTVETNTTFLLRQITIDTNQQEIPETATINIREDNAGQPGAVIETFNLEASDVILYAAAFGDPIYHMTFDLDTPQLFTEGTYWIEPFMNTPSGEVVWWLATSTNPHGSAPYRSTDGGNTWEIDTNGLDMVFFVAGDCEELGLSDISNSEFVYWPNPTTDVLNLSAQKAVKTVEAYNMAGQKVIATKSISNQIDLSSLTPGTYVFRVVLEGGQIETFKVIKK